MEITKKKEVKNLIWKLKVGGDFEHQLREKVTLDILSRVVINVSAVQEQC